MTSAATRALVAGGAGFLGSHLCDRLIENGANVLCVDNLATSSQANIEHLAGHSRFEFLEHDVTTPIDVDVDEIYNLASPASPIQYQRDPVQTVRTNVIGALNMLDLAHRKGARIFQASTSEVYGDPLVHPQPETYWGNVNPTGIRSCYDEGKRVAETLFFDYRRQHGVEIKVVRIFNTYGPRMDAADGRVVSNFIAAALAGKPLTVYGDGSQTRSFCFVDDLIEGFIRMMRSPARITGPINLGNSSEFTMLELAQLVVDKTGSTAGIEYLPLPADDPTKRRPVLDLALAELAWAPRVNLSDGLDRTIDWFRAESLGPDDHLP